jgi:hypothetical protein
MKQIYSLFLFLFFALAQVSYGQLYKTTYDESGYNSFTSDYTLPGMSSTLVITSNAATPLFGSVYTLLYNNGQYLNDGSMMPIDMTSNKLLYIRAKASIPGTQLRVDLRNTGDYSTTAGISNDNNILTLTGTYQTYVIDYTGAFDGGYGGTPCGLGGCTFDFSSIKAVNYFLAPGLTGDNGSVYIDYLSIGADFTPPSTVTNYVDHYTTAAGIVRAGSDNFTVSNDNLSNLIISSTPTAPMFSSAWYYLYDNDQMSKTHGPLNVNMNSNKTVYVRAKASTGTPKLRVDVGDRDGNSTTMGVVNEVTLSTSYQTFTFIYTGGSDGGYGGTACLSGPCAVDFTKIANVGYFVNASTGGYNGSIIIDYIAFVNNATACTQIAAAPTITNATSTVCTGNNYTLTASSTGTGVAYSWIQDATTTLTNTGNVTGATTASATFTGFTAGNAGSYTVTSSNYCTAPQTSAAFVLSAGGPAPTANASADQTVCSNNANVTLAGSMTIATGATWTSSGTGTFAPNATTMNATYSPSAADKTAGSATLTLTTTTGNGTCNAGSDQMTVFISPAPNVGLVVSQVTPICTSTNGTVTVAASQSGVSYQAYIGATPVGAAVTGTGATISLIIPSASLSVGTNTITIKATAGVCTPVTLTNPASIVVNAVTAPTIALGNSSKIFGDVPFSIATATSNSAGAFTYSFVSSTPASILTVTAAGNVTINGAGTATVQVSQAAAGCYSAGTQTATVTVAKANRTAAVTSSNTGTVGLTISLTNTVSVGTGAATWSVTNGTGSATVSGTTLTATGAGTVTVTVNIAADANYNAASANQTITIGKATPTATITSANTGTAGGTINLTNTLSGGTGAAFWSVTNVTGSATISGTTLTLTGVGTITVTLNIAADANYNATSATQTITISKGTPTAAITSANTGTVGGTIGLTYTVTGGTGAAFWSVTNVTGAAAISGTTLTLTGAGTVTLTLNIAADANYNASSATQTVTIGKANRTVSITSTSNGTISSSINLTSSAVPSGGTTFWSVTNGTGTAGISGTTLNLTTAGTVTVRVDIPGDADYNAAFATQVVTISAQPTPTVTLADLSKTFGDPSFTLAATSNSSGTLTYSLVSSTPSSIVTVAANGTVTILGAGSATVNVDQAASASFGAGSATATITIAKASRTAAVTSASTGAVNGTINLTNTVSAGTGTASWSVVNGTGTASLSGTTLTLAGAGTVTVTVDIAADANYNAASANQVITISTATGILDPLEASMNVYPNPFETTCAIEFDLATGGVVDLDVYDMIGQKTVSLMKGENLASGLHTVSLSDLNSGAYIVKLKVGNKVKYMKVIKN